MWDVFSQSHPLRGEPPSALIPFCKDPAHFYRADIVRSGPRPARFYLMTFRRNVAKTRQPSKASIPHITRTRGSLIGDVGRVLTEVAMTSNDEDVAIKGKYTAMFLCWVLGTGGQFAWNSLLTTLDYYIAIYPDYHPSGVLTIAVLSFAFGIITILTYYEAEMNNRLRNLIGFTIYVIGSVLVVLNLATSGNGSIGAYIGMCSICVSFGVAEGFVQGAMGGDLSFMCQEFIQSFSAGVAASGTQASVLRLAIKAAFENTKGGLRKGALVFLAVTAFFELVCLLLYAYVFVKLPIIKYYHSKAAAEASKTVSIDLTVTQIQVQANPSDGEDHKLLERLSNKQLLLKKYRLCN